jgi:hypothetical protein
VSENTQEFIVKTWLEDHPEHHSVSLPHPEEEAIEMQQSAENGTPNTKATIEPYTGQIPGQH